MHYYQFNIGDYASHTAHLDPIEDIAYRRMLDWCYTHEVSLPEDVESIARLIRMRDHGSAIRDVLNEFLSAQMMVGFHLAFNVRLTTTERKLNRRLVPVKHPLNVGSTDVQRTFNQPITKNQ